MKVFQQSVHQWCIDIFGLDVAKNIKIRCFRFCEEALELCQSLGMTRNDAHRLVDYVFSRPVGEPHQEMGGVMVTLAALAEPAGLDMEVDGWKEADRCNLPEVKAKIQAKQKTKLGTSSLPGGAVDWHAHWAEVDEEGRLGFAASMGKTFLNQHIAEQVMTHELKGDEIPKARPVWIGDAE